MLYREVSNIIDTVHSKKGSPKSLVLASQYKNKKQLLALVCETLKYNEVLSHIISSSKLREHERLLSSETMAKVLVYDLIFGKGIQGSGKLQKAVMRHKASLQAELARLKIKKKVIRNEDLLPDSTKLRALIPRYVRVNLIKTSVECVIQDFQKDGYELLTPNCSDALRFLEVIKQLKPKQFVQDFHLADLLVFPGRTDLHANKLYLDGHIILQDKASCMPAFVLSPPTGSHVIDCCAAPGNKTSHAASLMGNKGKIFSYDLDMKRLSTMNTLITKAGVTCAELCHQDFLKVNPADEKYSRVEYIIVDPSCSGSGIVSRQDGATENEEISKERLENLSTFQTSILKHALSFPNAKRVIYSTCSTHEEENENVTKQALEAYNDKFYLKSVLPEWPHRGQGDFTEAKHCLRFTPGNDMTNGFFVACFQKRESRNGLSADNVCIDSNANDLSEKHITDACSSECGEIGTELERKRKLSKTGEEGDSSSEAKRNVRKKKKKKKKRVNSIIG